MRMQKGRASGRANPCKGISIYVRVCIDWELSKVDLKLWSKEKFN